MRSTSAEASSRRVFHRWRLSTSTCRRPQNASTTALSQVMCPRFVGRATVCVDPPARRRHVVASRVSIACGVTRAGRLRVVLALNLLLVGGLVAIGLSAHSLGVLAEGVDYLCLLYTSPSPR